MVNDTVVTFPARVMPVIVGRAGRADEVLNVNAPFAFALVARVAAGRGDAYRAGTFWGVVDALEARESIPNWWATQRRVFEAALAAVAGADFDRGRERGRTLTPAEALEEARAPGD